MLNLQFRYVGIDFETTGLDINKDEPIQIGIIEIDASGKIIDQFESLIKPTKDTSELKSIVGFITGLSLKDLENSPSVEDIYPHIEKFFTPNTIIIGHNVAFDISFLNKFFPNLKYHSTIDTVSLMQNFIHYAPSYALDVLTKHIQENKVFNQLNLDRKFLSEGEESFHDALCDTQNSLGFFLYIIKYFNLIKSKYPIVGYFLSKHSVFSQIITNIEDISMDDIQVPRLERISPSNTSFKTNDKLINVLDLQSLQRYYVGNVGLKEILEGLLSNKNLILSFSNKPKMDIVKNILNDMGIKNIGFAREDQTINYDSLFKFVNKKDFEDGEIMFILKYISHLYQGYGVLDLNSKFDYQVYYFLKDTRDITRYPIILTTHGGLFSLIEDQKEHYHGYDICFFDMEWRYKNYNYYLSRTCDLYYILNLIEMFIYKYKLNYQLGLCDDKAMIELQNFCNFFQIFIGEVFIETKNFFTNNANTSMQINPIVDSLDFVKTNSLLSQFQYYKDSFQSLLGDDFKQFWSGFNHMINVFGGIMYVSKKMYNQGDFYFVYGESSKFTNRSEFTDIFNSFHTIFLSHYDQTYKAIKESIFTANISAVRLETVEKIGNFLDMEESKNLNSIFILSTQKEESKAIFDMFLSKGIDKENLILIENITGGFGKNIFKSKSNQKKILVGGYNFLMSCYGNKVKFDKLIVFNIRGSQEKNILNDVKWYAYQNYSQS
ncbi:MAG: 3'-5' exonuclease [Candidatus Absconditicoccaceae bacterium]